MSACACREAAADGGGETPRRGPSVATRARGLVTWALPGALLVLVPKCPVCLAGYVALATGVGVSVATATLLRWSLLALGLGALAALATRLALRLGRRRTRAA